MIFLAWIIVYVLLLMGFEKDVMFLTFLLYIGISMESILNKYNK
ncbi:hypothetical protein [Clostridium rectalis]|nr:hypothetical protein [Clostridium rectalis]